MKIPTIRKKNFILRPLAKGDEASIAENANDKTVYYGTSHLPYPYSKKDEKLWIAKNLLEYKKKNPVNVNFGIDVDGGIVGAIGLMSIEGHKAEIRYWLGKNYRRKGIMTEAVKAVTKYGFKELGLKRIYAKVFQFNKASKSVLENAGYSLEGVFKKDVLKDGKLIDDWRFAKVR